MNSIVLLFVTVCIFAVCQTSVLKFEPQYKTARRSKFPWKDAEEWLKILFDPTGKRSHNLKSSLRVCGGSAVKIDGFSLDPDPLHFPGTLNLMIKAELGVKISQDNPVKVKLEWKEKTESGWILYPCVAQKIGSCTYENICDTINFSPCPDILVQHNIPCSCPFDARTYSLVPAIEIAVDASAFPSGEFNIIANVTNNNNLLTCLEFDVTISS